nr:MAG TPA: hypothetical protein [Caudoviricetes sp.]
MSFCKHLISIFHFLYSSFLLLFSSSFVIVFLC